VSKKYIARPLSVFQKESRSFGEILAQVPCRKFILTATRHLALCTVDLLQRS